MGRLITEEAVYEYLSSKFDEFDISIFGNEFAGKILDGLSDIPTAYDVEKVVVDIRRCSGNGYRDVDGDSVPPMIETEYAIDIVKRGGVE